MWLLITGSLLIEVLIKKNILVQYKNMGIHQFQSTNIISEREFFLAHLINESVLTVILFWFHELRNVGKLAFFLFNRTLFDWWWVCCVPRQQARPINFVPNSSHGMSFRLIYLYLLLFFERELYVLSNE